MLLQLLILNVVTGTFASDRHCNHCTSILNDDDIYGPYDPDCKSTAYHGGNTTLGEVCRTIVLDDGNVRRLGWDDSSDVNTCVYENDYLRCDCAISFCNRDLCEWCTTTDLQCYHCSSNPDEDIFPYDPECNSNTYAGQSTSAGYACRTIAFEDGNVRRYPISYFNENDTCYRGSTNEQVQYLRCDCQEEGPCNDNLCEWCGADGLQCYSCTDCDEVNGDTQVISSPDYKACSTNFFLATGTVMRGASLIAHPDGECIDQQTTLDCYCTTNLCNDIVSRRMPKDIQN